MQDFLWAVADRLRRLFPEGAPVYFGRLLQGERTPCFYLPPPALRRQLWPCGRVRREIELELCYYPRQRRFSAETAANSSAAQNLSGLSEQERIGEGLVRGMGELTGRRRGYRGRELSWQAGNECLRFKARYVYYTTLELEAADGWSEPPAGADLMEFWLLADSEDNNDNIVNDDHTEK